MRVPSLKLRPMATSPWKPLAAFPLAVPFELPAGSVTVDGISITVASTAEILVNGVLLPGAQPAAEGLPGELATLDGGEISLLAASTPTQTGNIVIEDGAVLDISGTPPTERTFIDESGELSRFLLAGDAGALRFRYGGNLQIDGEIRAASSLEGLEGGGLVLEKNLSSLEEALLVDQAFFDRWLALGVEDLTLINSFGIEFTESVDVDIPRRLELDTPTLFFAEELVGDGVEDSVRLNAPIVELTNVFDKFGSITSSSDFNSALNPRLNETLLSGENSYSFSADWLKVFGNVNFSGADTVRLSAANDIQLQSEQYGNVLGTPGISAYLGRIRVPGDIDFTAARIYPIANFDFDPQLPVPTVFTIRAGENGPGAVRFLSSGREMTGPAFSAGNTLRVFGEDIFVGEDGATSPVLLASPFGTLELNAENRLYVAENGRLSVSGESVVRYGQVDEEGIWRVAVIEQNDPEDDFDDVPTVGTVESAPEKNIVLTAGNDDVSGEILVRDGAVVEGSGGGSVFSFFFQPSTSGSNNPLDGRIVVLPDGDGVLPGRKIRLSEGAAGLPAGDYTILPEEFAFLEGAFVLENIGTVDTGLVPGQEITAEGYPVVPGYFLSEGDNQQSPVLQGFWVRDAADVLSEGLFNPHGFRSRRWSKHPSCSGYDDFGWSFSRRRPRWL